MALQIGDILDGKYRIVRLLGEGGMGAVFEGENTRIHRRVAIKVLHAGVASNEDAVQRFEREAQAAGRIGSEHIVEVLDLGHLPDGERYMVMEFLEGESLADRISGRGRLSPQATGAIVVDILEGLRAAHEAGIVHRDLKPDNVFLLASRSGKKDFVKLVDFGISKFNTMGGEFSMTRTGAVMGTPYYMSPEQAKGNRGVDHRADLYAVGVILYEAVVGEVPFNAETFNELLFKIVLEQPTPLDQRVPGIDPDFARIVEKAMARDPDQRFLTAVDFQSALKSWLAGQPLAPDVTATAGTSPLFERTVLPSSPDGVRTFPQTGTQAGGLTAAPAARGTLAAGAPLTQGNFASTGAFEQTGGGSKKMAFVAAAVLVLAVSGGFVVWKQSSNADAERELAARAEADEREAARQADLARIEAERAKAEAERAKAEQAMIEAEKAKTHAETTSEKLRRLEEERRAAEAKATVRGASAAPVVKKPTPAEPPPAPATTPSSGRKIRTDL